MNLSSILKKPVITEKSIKHATGHVFTFIVNKNANKNQIKQAVEDFYDVDVTKVYTSVTRGKSYRVGKTRVIKLRPPVKKARVQLQKGQKIDIFDVEEEK